ncbi:MAG: RNA polymerase sigma-70 factor [Pedobacter sp.]|nr:MAG: RNA polymerase sigma-70 factor [Pedobacter sp.]
MSENFTDNRGQILLSASEGDQKAFAHLFYEYSPPLLSFARRLSYSSVEAEEIIQNVFLRVWLHKDKLPEIENVKSWLYKFVVNESLTYIRKKAIKNKADHHFYTNEISFHNDIENTVNLNELKYLVAEAVNYLPEQRRKIFNLSRNEGLSIAEISQQLGIAPSTVKNTLTVSLKFVRDYLKPYGYSSLIFIALIMK